MSSQQLGAARANMLEFDELSAFSLRMNMMLKAGITVTDGLQLMASESEDKEERSLLQALYQVIDTEGCPFFEALTRCGGFPDYYIKMVEIGELSGRLEQVTEGLAAHYRREAALAAGIRQTISYPISMGLVLSGVIFVILTRVLPLFEQAYRELGSEMKPLAAALVQFGRAAERSGAFLGGLVCALALCGMFLLYTRPGRRRFFLMTSSLMSRGRLGERMSVSRFASGMTLMLASGVSLDQAVAQAKELVEHPGTTAVIDRLIERMNTGETFPAAAAKVGLFTGLDAGLLSSGFQSGNAEVAMQEIAERCADEVTQRLERAVGRIEPIVVAALSGVIALVLLSVMLPLIGILGSVG